MNRKQVDVLREEAFQLMRDRALSPPLLPEQHVLAAVPYLTAAVAYVRAAAELGEVIECAAMFKVLADCLTKEAEFIKAKQDYLHVLAQVREVKGDGPD